MDLKTYSNIHTSADSADLRLLTARATAPFFLPGVPRLAIVVRRPRIRRTLTKHFKAHLS